MELKSNATVLFMVLHQCVGLDEAIPKFSHATKTFPCNENYVWLSVLRPFVAAVPAFVAEAKSQSRVDEISNPASCALALAHRDGDKPCQIIIKAQRPFAPRGCQRDFCVLGLD